MAVIQHGPGVVIPSLGVDGVDAATVHLVLDFTCQRLDVGGGGTRGQHHVVADVGLSLHGDDLDVAAALVVKEQRNGLGKLSSGRARQRCGGVIGGLQLGDDSIL